MVGMAVGLVLAGAAIAVVINTSNAARGLNESSVQVENGRYATGLLRDELTLSGFYGRWSQPPAPGTVAPDPCLTSAADLQLAWPFYVQGYPGGSSSPLPACVADTDYIPQTDIIVVRRVETSSPDRLIHLSDADSYAGQPLIQANGSAGVFDLATGSDTTNATRFHLKDRANNPAELRRFITRIYYVSPYSRTTGDGIPTLKRIDLETAGGVPSLVGPTSQVEGVEDLQLEFGVDNAGITAGAPDAFITSTAIAVPEDWGRIVAVRVHLLIRSLATSPGIASNRTYELGPDEIDPTKTHSVTPNDHFRRRAYSFTARLVNPSIRRKYAG
jgi:type IV pilus assembly protein PilW